MSSPAGEQASAPSRMVFVDDTDPSIKYNGFDWHPQTYSTGNATSFSSFPLYGTLHFTESLGGTTNVTYSYQGSSVIAKFSSTSLSNVTCTLDSVSLKISPLDTLGGALCSSASAVVGDGNHEFVIGLEGINSTPGDFSLFFDGLYYTPSTGTTPTGDILITSDPALNLGSSQSTEWHWDFEFTGKFSCLNSNLSSSTDTYKLPGYSMSLYINYNSELSVVRTNGSYTIDNQGPFNFTSADPLFASTAPQLFVQTPRYELGQHKFHLDYWHDGETIPFSFYGITVQNSTATVDQSLEVVPPVPTSSSSPSQTPSPTPSPNPTETSSNQKQPLNHTPILIGSIIGVVVFLTILLTTWFLLRRRRARRRARFSLDLGSDMDSINPGPVIHPFPFSPPNPNNTSGSIVQTTSNHPTKSAESEAERRPFVNVSGNTTTSSLTPPVPATRPPHVRLLVHEDSGEDVAQPEPEPDTLTEIIELPPDYTSLGRNGRRGRERALPSIPTLTSVGAGEDVVSGHRSRPGEALDSKVGTGT